jgi:hypothetical protein
VSSETPLDDVTDAFQWRAMMDAESKISAAKIIVYGLPFVFLFAFFVEVVSWFSPDVADRVLHLVGAAALLVWMLAIIACALRLLLAIGIFLSGGHR